MESPGGTYYTVSGEAQVGRTPQDSQASQKISFKMKKVESLPIALKTMPDMFERGGNLGFFSITRESSPVSSLSDIERTLRPFPSSADHEPSQTLQTQSEIKPSSETFQRKFTDTPSLSGTVLEQEKENQEVLLLTRRTSVQTQGHTVTRQKLLVSFHKVWRKNQPASHKAIPLLCSFQSIPGAHCFLGVKSLVQQKPSTPRHEVSLKSQIHVLTPTYQSEETKRQSKEKHEEMSKLTRVKEKDEKSKKSPFQKLVSHFLQWIHSTPTIKGQESPPQKVKLTAATAQRKKKPCEENNVAEAQELMTAIEQLLEKNMMQQCKLCFQGQTAQGYSSTFPVRLPMTIRQSPTQSKEEHPATQPIPNAKKRHIKDQPSQKNVRFIKEAHTPQHPRLLPLNKTLKLVCSAQNEAIVPMVPSCHLCCPRHRAVQRSICSQLENSSQNLGPILEKISKDQNSSLEKTPVKLQEANLLESERNALKSLKKDSRSDSTKQINKTRKHSESSSGRNSHQALKGHIAWFQVKHRKTKPDMFERGGNLGFFSITRESSPCVFSFCKDIERTPRPFPPGADHVLSQVLQTQSEMKPSSETLQWKFTNTPSLSGTVLEQERETQEVLLLTRRTSVQNPGAHSHQAKTVMWRKNQPASHKAIPLLLSFQSIPGAHCFLQTFGFPGVKRGQEPGVVQQKPSTPKHQVSPKSQIQVLAPTYQGEETKRKSKEKHGKGSTHNSLKKNTNLEENTTTPFQKPHSFLQKAPSKNLLAAFFNGFTLHKQSKDRNLLLR
ncbi:LOW QUALITY PROTEIN: hypothetical protein U0070_023609 [Myodes glareolus]|uniref:Uncharacterized protein n=1 Tax=Myodes glareolus TaxID=447135 RepID=A0AAW0IPU1_MYOGA